MGDRIDEIVETLKSIEKVGANPQTQNAINRGIFYTLWLVAEELREIQEKSVDTAPQK